jgi:hypothetical protein
MRFDSGGMVKTEKSMGGRMQWWWVISAEQWSALGTMVGGIAQVGLVGVAVFTTREWVHQTRSSAIQSLVTKYFEIIHVIFQKYALMQFLHGSRNKLEKSVRGPQSKLLSRKEEAVIDLDNQRLVLLNIAIQCELYSEDLYSEMQKMNTHLQNYAEAYLELESINVVDREYTQPKSSARHAELKEYLYGAASKQWIAEFEEIHERCVSMSRRLVLRK